METNQIRRNDVFFLMKRCKIALNTSKNAIKIFIYSNRSKSKFKYTYYLLKSITKLMFLQEDASRILAVAWSPNNSKLAVCNNERIVYLFSENGEKKDKFPTKAADSKVSN